MTELEEAKLQAYEVSNQLRGLPTRETLKAAYLQFDFDRNKVAAHFNITSVQLNAIKKKLLGDKRLPPHASYVRQWNEVKWYTGVFPKWTHITPTKSEEGPGHTFYKSR